MTWFRHRREHLWIEGVHISPDDCPECLRREESDWSEFQCDQCRFFAPWDCPLVANPWLAQEVKTVLDVSRERREAAIARRTDLIEAVRVELEMHGRPVHYAILARVIAQRHPDLHPTASEVNAVLSSNPVLFERIFPGVYRCKRVPQD